jgi:hypothetical protein
MSQSVQQFLADSTKEAASELMAALERVPEDKRAWSAMGDARTALDQVAECALLSGWTADVIRDRAWPETMDMEGYFKEKARVAQNPAGIGALLQENTEKAVAAILGLSDEELGATVQTSFGPRTWLQMATYPYWNMSYHQGQINYIASMLGCLK